MYRAFELKIDEKILEDNNCGKDIKLGQITEKNDAIMVDGLLRDVIVNGTIDGTMLTEEYFPIFHKDVFISYSHNNRDLAYYIAGRLNSCFGLSVFLIRCFGEAQIGF